MFNNCLAHLTRHLAYSLSPALLYFAGHLARAYLCRSVPRFVSRGAPSVCLIVPRFAPCGANRVCRLVPRFVTREAPRVCIAYSCASYLVRYETFPVGVTVISYLYFKGMLLPSPRELYNYDNLFLCYL